jgi:hypothetical protein
LKKISQAEKTSPEKCSAVTVGSGAVLMLAMYSTTASQNLDIAKTIKRPHQHDKRLHKQLTSIFDQECSPIPGCQLEIKTISARDKVWSKLLGC